MRWLPAALCIVAAVVTACSDGDGSDGGPVCIDNCTEAPQPRSPTPELPVGTTPPGGASTLASCSPAKGHAAGDADGTIMSGGLERTYILHIPPRYDGATPLPLVINLHGFSSNARSQANYSRLPALGEEEGFIVVSPNGTGNPSRWTFPGLGDVDDVAFIGELLDALEAELCIDMARVYAAGMSNGAAISTFIACGMPDRIAAIGEVGATAGPRACGTDEPIPIISFRGTEDACVPYEGGTSTCGMMLPVLPAEEVMQLWGEHNGCEATPRSAQVSEHVRTTEYVSCEDGAGTMLYTVEGDGHTWPGSVSVGRLGHTTDEIDATAIMWEFFEQHAR